MPIQSGSFTVIHFKHLLFHGTWSQLALINFYEYAAGKSAKLVVIEETKSGTNYTWNFTLGVGDLVTVNYADSQVHVPALPSRSRTAAALQTGDDLATTPPSRREGKRSSRKR